eukprot:2063101-Lingulodinium_polyedra.AAC.1
MNGCCSEGSGARSEGGGPQGADAAGNTPIVLHTGNGPPTHPSDTATTAQCPRTDAVRGTVTGGVGEP